MKHIWRGGTLLSPTPAVLVTSGNMEMPNVFTVGWTGIVNTVPPRTYVSVRPSRYSYGLIKASGEFVINLTTPSLIRAADICGVYSGRDKDKFALCGLTRERSATVSAPSILESPLCLECRVFNIIPLGSHDMFLADITAVRVDDSLLDENGALKLDRCGIAAYAHGSYYELKRPVAKLGFAVKKRHNKSEKMR